MIQAMSDEEYWYKVACMTKYSLGLCTRQPLALPVGHLQKCTFLFIFSYDRETQQGQHVS